MLSKGMWRVMDLAVRLLEVGAPPPDCKTAGGCATLVRAEEGAMAERAADHDRIDDAMLGLMRLTPHDGDGKATIGRPRTGCPTGD